MPDYVAKALKQFQHMKPTRRQDAPYPCAQIQYGAKKQYATQESTAPALDKKGKRFIQQVCENSYSLAGQLILHSSA